MVDGRPLDYGDVPTAAARLVIVLLPAGERAVGRQPSGGRFHHCSLAVARHVPRSARGRG